MKQAKNLNNKNTTQEERLEKDFKIARAIDLIKGLNIYKESISE